MTAAASDDGGEASLLLQRLVDGLRQRGLITDARVEAAFRAVPRHCFLPDQPLSEVYRDQAIVTKTEDGRPISSSSQPAIMAIMLEQLDPRPGQRVLEIGAGAGYNAALLARLVAPGGSVVSVDIDCDLIERAKGHLAAAGADGVELVCDDGGRGYAPGAPYDRIILTVGAWDIAPAWREQLALRGRMVLPLSLGGAQKSIAFEQEGECLRSRSLQDCGFMRLRGAFAGPDRHLRLGPTPTITLSTESEQTPDAGAVYALLSGPHADLPGGVRVTPGEVFGGLMLWLGLRLPGLVLLQATGEARELGLVPSLFGFGERIDSTAGFLAPGDLALLVRQQPPPANEQIERAPAFELFVRSAGSGALAARLIDEIRAWDAAGRRASDRVEVRACPLSAAIAPRLGEIVIDRRWTRFLLGWR